MKTYWRRFRLKNTGSPRFYYPVLILEREKYNFFMLIHFYAKMMQQHFICQLPGLIPTTKKNGSSYNLQIRNSNKNKCQNIFHKYIPRKL